MTQACEIEHRLRVLRLLNDNARRFFVGVRVVVTASIAADPTLQYAVLRKVRQFQDFKEEDDVDRDHSFGALEHQGETFWWRIDYYDPDMEHGSEDPTDTQKTVRVLTVMRPSEH